MPLVLLALEWSSAAMQANLRIIARDVLYGVGAAFMAAFIVVICICGHAMFTLRRKKEEARRNTIKFSLSKFYCHDVSHEK